MFLRGKTKYIIVRAKSIRFMGTAFSCALVLFLLLAIFPITKISNDVEAAVVPATTTLAIVSSKDTASVEITPNSPTGTFATSSSENQAEFSVSTDNLTGYSIAILGSDTSGQLVNSSTGDVIDTLASDTSESNFRNGSASSYANKWGYRLNINGTITSDFMPAPTSSTSKTIYFTESPNAAGTSDNFTLGVGARVDYEKPTGTYTNTLILTAVGNPISYQIDYIDNYGGTDTVLEQDAAANITASGFTISAANPTRSGATFKGWCYGTVDHTGNSSTCSGTPGEVYHSGDDFTFSTVPSAGIVTANLYAMWERIYTMQELTLDQCTAMPITVVDSRDNQRYIAQRLADGNCWMMTNLNLGATNLTVDLDNTNTNIARTVSASTFNNWRKTAGTNSFTSGEYISLAGTDTNTGNPYGTLYNYHAATAGTVTGSTSSVQTTEDICPAGWRLPTSGSGGEFANLYAQAEYNTVAKMRAPISEGGAAFALAGSFQSGAPVDVESNGSYWSSTYYNTTGRYDLFISTTSINTARFRDRSYGYSIRCILDESTLFRKNGVYTMQDFGNLASDKKKQLVDAMDDTKTYVLSDARDSKKYNLAKLADGNVWMTSNLNLAGGTTLNADTSDVPTDNYYTLPASSTTGFDDNTKAYVYNTGNETADQTDCYKDHPCNSYYSWLAATAGGKDASGTAVTDNGQDAAYSICPKGWRLPKSGGRQSDAYKKGDFYKLATAYGANLESNYYQDTRVFNNNAGPGTLPNFLRAGYYGSSVFHYGLTYGNYWSSTPCGSTCAYSLYFSSSYVSSSSNDARRYGFSVRCVIYPNN